MNNNYIRILFKNDFDENKNVELKFKYISEKFNMDKLENFLHTPEQINIDFLDELYTNCLTSPEQKVWFSALPIQTRIETYKMLTNLNIQDYEDKLLEKEYQDNIIQDLEKQIKTEEGREKIIKSFKEPQKRYIKNVEIKKEETLLEVKDETKLSKKIADLLAATALLSLLTLIILTPTVLSILGIVWLINL